jgi:hypothetical protein
VRSALSGLGAGGSGCETGVMASKPSVKNGRTTGTPQSPSAHGVVHRGRTGARSNGARNGNGNGARNGNGNGNSNPGNSRNNTTAPSSPPKVQRGEPTDSPPKSWWDTLGRQDRKDEPMRIAAGLHALADAMYTPGVEDLPARSRVQDTRLYQGSPRKSTSGNNGGTTRQPTNPRSKASNGGNGNGKVGAQTARQASSNGSKAKAKVQSATRRSR